MSFGNIGKLVSLLFTCLALPFSAHAQDSLPHDWPWKGVSIEFPGGGVSDLERYRGRLPINVVRLNIDARRYAEINHVDSTHALQNAMDWTDSMLDACASLGIGAVVQINHFPIDPTVHVLMSDPVFWESADSQNEIISVSRELVERFSRRGGELAAYQIVSEPVVYISGRAIAPPQWPELLNRIVAEIRKIDTDRWIIVSPGPGGIPQGYTDFRPPKDQRLIWGSHVYLPYAFTHQGIKGRELHIKYPGTIRFKHWDRFSLCEAMEPLRRFQKRHPAPVFIGEFSAVRWGHDAEQYLVDLASCFNNYEWGWSYFSATGWHGWNPDYNNEYSNDDPKNWSLDYVGEKSARWLTLKAIFNGK